MKKIWFSIICLIYLSAQALVAQRFEGSLKIAGTLSQIDGDDIYGFHKPGYEIGGFVSARLSKTTALETGISYNLRGSHYSKNDLLRVAISLQYIDIPVLFVLRDWLNETGEDEYYQMEFFGGLSLGRLVGSSSLSGVDRDFKKTDVSYILGASYFWSKNWGGSAKYTRSFTSLYEYSKNGGFIQMTSYYLSLGLKYKFN
ncbi:MAG: PorT family protein [Saprospiraceae bacterium]|nr:PorT family protein [Saprospiraceae bacterium]